MDKTIGSLFDGIGGFPLAGSSYGLTTLWASEIEPFPIKVTKTRLPDMKHLGDITKINGAEIEPVAAVCGGSPCQDASIAGKQAGLAGERSGLFFQQVRIIKEMREADEKRGRTGKSIRPRFMVWENVPGFFSSPKKNRGEDFRVVLEEICRIVDSSVSIPRPPRRSWLTAGRIVGNNFSIAWRVQDAQYWGVPQRRRRIFLVADFAGQSAPEILFKPEGVSWNTSQSAEARKRYAADAERSAGETSGCGLTGCVPKVARTLTARADSSPCVDRGQNIIAIPINDKATRYNGGGPTRNEDGAGNGLGIGEPGDPAPTLSCGDRHAVAVSAGFIGGMGAKAGNIGYQEEMAPTLKAEQPSHVVCYDARGNGDGSTAAILTGDHQNRITDYTSLALTPCYTIDKAAYNSGKNSSFGFQVDEDLSPTITSRHPPAACYPKVSGTLTSKMAKGTGGPAGDECQNLISCYFAVRRLTPLECERLQGYPDGWTDIPGASDSARYKALGNSVAVPCVAYIMRGIAEELDRAA